VGFFNPRAICPNCGAKIHTQDALPGPRFPGGGIQRTGKQCPQCGIPLTGKVGFLGNTAQIDQARVKQGNKTATAATGQRSGADELEKLGMLRKDGVLTEEEFSAAKGRVLSGEETSDGAPAESGGGTVVKDPTSQPSAAARMMQKGVDKVSDRVDRKVSDRVDRKRAEAEAVAGERCDVVLVTRAAVAWDGPEACESSPG